MATINDMLSKVDQLAADMHTMATCIDQLRIITIVMVVTGYLGGLVFLIFKLCTRGDRAGKLSLRFEDLCGFEEASWFVGSSAD